MQPTLQQVLAAARNKPLDSSCNTTSSISAPDSASKPPPTAAGGAAVDGQGRSKENRPVGGSAAAPASSQQTARQKQQTPVGQPVAQHSSGAKQQPGRSTQMFLDLGQRDFGASRCSVCGMVYAKGHEEDEKLHKAYHQGAMQGFKFQGWPQERVLMSEVAQGRLLMVLQTDPANHLKKVRELCACVEKAHGMAAGWLLSVPQARVFMYVSAQRRVVGLAVVEPLKQAYRVMAPEGFQEQEVDSSHAPQQLGTQQQQLGPEQASGSSALNAAAPQQQEQLRKRQPQQLLWPGLQKRSRLAALGRAAGSGGSMLLSDPAQRSGAAGGSSSNLKADSCPTSLLAATGRLQVQQAEAPVVLQPPTESSAGADVAAPQPVTQAAAAAEAAAVSAVQAGALSGLSQPEQQQQQQLAGQDVLLSAETRAMPPPPNKQQQQQVLSWRRDAAAAASIPNSSRAAAASSDAGRSVGGGVSGGAYSGTSSSIRRNSSKAAAAAGGSSSGKSLLVDQRRAVRAMLGVRMVWVSPEQRRKGVATKLLDAARCNMVPGYVVPCNQVAFCQPTGDGGALAAAFAGTQQFLVYGIK